jgi:hypothetical protein
VRASVIAGGPKSAKPREADHADGQQPKCGWLGDAGRLSAELQHPKAVVRSAQLLGVGEELGGPDQLRDYLLIGVAAGQETKKVRDAVRIVRIG